MKRILISFLATLALGSHVWAQAQTLDDQEVVDIEGLYKSKPTPVKKETPAEAAVASMNNDSEASSEVIEKKVVNQPINQPVNQPVNQSAKEEKVESLTDLNRLAPFREVSVIQKKYLPKTERFQLYVAPGMATNSPWFLNLGLKVNLAYHFTESFGLELSGLFLSNSEREVAKEIRDKNGLEPEKFVNTKNYVGADFFWAPIYGKISFLNDRIVPFDMYFTVGGGTSSTNSVENNVATLHGGVGQIFAMSKSMAFRWDYSWTHFSATSTKSSTGVAGAKNDYDDLILTAGFSFFFPEAKYR
ncbi:MAG: outer membrane beta-barrel domain-containing protein [Bdellovibrio sp.]|nr:outer membrane beta-barrel domain-containing protein [Bdellovibrio sp.]